MKRLGAITLAAVLAIGGLTACRGGDSDNGDTSSSGGPKVDVGITKEPCPKSEHKDRGCIYLGIISDLTVGPFKALAVPITEAQKAFWKRVNTQGGIGGYDVDAETYVRDNKYNPQTHNEVYQEIKGKVLALAQSLGSPTTAAILGDMKANNVLAAPAAWTSAYAFEDNILESGANYCIESMNAVDYANETFKPKTVMAVHLAGDYGDDAAAGTKIAAEKLGLKFIDVKTDSGTDKQAGAVTAIVTQKPDLVIVTAGPADVAAIVGGAAQRGFTGKFIGTSPTWNPGLLQSPAAPALKALYLQSSPWKTFSTDSPGHKAMRDALGSSITPNDGYTSGWVWSYPLLAALKKAQADGDLTRAGLLKAAKSLTKVDYEGMLPDGAGNYAGGADGIFRQTLIYNPAAQTSPTDIPLVKDYFTGPTAKDYKLDKPCYEKL
ncbi:ABC transporter substrate-binding protein [Dactylosporangium sp. NPDC005572]|uniref:ABC transporter substrate-binding protein n=1 Tax=Dactylosporangium sp. NPDC005572 TaxID=3156889 RepID=UPI0033A2CF5A